MSAAPETRSMNSSKRCSVLCNSPTHGVIADSAPNPANNASKLTATGNPQHNKWPIRVVSKTEFEVFVRRDKFTSLVAMIYVVK